MEQTNPLKKHRLRFSLLNLLLMTAIVALALGLWREHERLRPLEERVYQLRSELGIVDAPDPKKLYVRKLNDKNRWRVYVPLRATGKAMIIVRRSQEPKKAAGGIIDLPQGETSFAVSLVEGDFDIWPLTEERRRNIRGVRFEKWVYGPLKYVNSDKLSDLSSGVNGKDTIVLVKASAEDEEGNTLELRVEVSLK